MIKIKHFMDAREDDDGDRLWVEPIGLTKDLIEWCSVDHLLPHLGPPRELANWFEEHAAEGYEFFRGKYHEHLNKNGMRKALWQLARAGLSENFTLLHQGEDAEQNTATALYEYLTELSAHLSGE
jgi:uncharacterized protein YeaO (DUF488 family)